MIQLKTKIGSIKRSNLVFLVEKQADVDKLTMINISPEIKKDIFSQLRSGKNVVKEYFIGNAHFSSLFVLVYKDHQNSIIDAFGNKIPSLPDNITGLSNVESNAITLLNLIALRKYSFDSFKQTTKEKELFFLCSKDEEKLLKERVKDVKNIYYARDMGTRPSNELTPEKIMKEIKAYKWKNCKIKILTPKDIEKKKLLLIHGVGKGSENKPYMVIIEKIPHKKAPLYGLVGKGITFDSGGIQVKPGNSMYEMKGDMCGAAAVIGAMRSLDTSDLNVNVVACLCLAENAISSSSYKPSDILRSYSGKTVDIIHTDAEGRLVMADGISYISKNYKTDNMMTVATLTGACMVALGFRYAGIMGDDTGTINRFKQLSQEGYEKIPGTPFG